MGYLCSLQIKMPGCLALIATLLCQCSIGVDSQMEIRAEFGGNVTFHCPYDKNKVVYFLYHQKSISPSFMNGFHASHPVSPGRTGTQVNHSDGSMVMERLEIQDSGLYDCLVQYKGRDTIYKVMQINLTVTASYSKPNISMDCMDEICNVRCFSYGGYPDHSMTWNVSGDTSLVKQWLIIGSPDKLEDPDTKLFNISSTASVNCSNRAPRNISCSVGEVTSDELTVCEQQSQHPSSNVTVIIAICVAVLVALVALVVVYRKCSTKNAPGDEDTSGTELQGLNVIESTSVD